MIKFKVEQKHPAFDVLIAVAKGKQIEGKLVENGKFSWCDIPTEVALLFISRNHFIHELRVKPKDTE